MEDIDLNPDDFVSRVNSDLVGKYVNIASRCGRLHRQAFRRQARHPNVASELQCALLANAAREIAGHYDSASTARRCARSCSSRTSLTSTSIRKAVGPREISPTGGRAARGVLDAPRAFRDLTCYLKPVLPRLAARSGSVARHRR